MPDLASLPPVGNAASSPAPAWHNALVPLFFGRESHAGTDKPYHTVALAQLFSAAPTAHQKPDVPAFIPSTYSQQDAREHAVQRDRGQFVALTGDIDSGDHPLDAIERAVGEFAGDAAQVVYSSSSSRPGNRKWRVILPLASPVDFQTWHVAQTLFHDHFAAAGIEPDRSLARAGQPVFAPNVPPIHVDRDGTQTALRDDDGEPLYFLRVQSDMNADGLDLAGGVHALDIRMLVLAAIEEDARCKEAAEDAARKRRERAGAGSTMIERFNEENDLADLLATYGYEDAPYNSTDWRSPLQTSGSFATRVATDDYGRQYWISLSQSDRDAGLGRECLSGCHGDAFDLYVHYEHRGDPDAALAVLRKREQVSAFEGVSLPPVEYKAEVRIAAETRPASGSSMRWAQSGDSYDPDEDQWLISGMIPAVGTGFMSGAWQSGKTFLLYHLAACLGSQADFFGELPDTRFSTIILQSENFGSGRKRLRALDVARGATSDALPIHVADAGGFGVDAERDAMLLAIEQRAKLIREANAPSLGLIGIDTLSASRLLAEENSNDSAAKAVEFMNLLSRRFECFVLALHHPPKSSNGLRGGGALAGNVDVVIEIQREGTAAVRKVECIKQRDGEQKHWGCFTLPPVVIGTRSDGREVTSCTVSTGALPLHDEKVSGAKLAALKILDALSGIDGRASLSAWRDQCAAPDAISSAETNKSRRDVVGRTLRELKALGLVETGEEAGGWLARKTLRLEGEPISLPEV